MIELKLTPACRAPNDPMVVTAHEPVHSSKPRFSLELRPYGPPFVAAAAAAVNPGAGLFISGSVTFRFQLAISDLVIHVRCLPICRLFVCRTVRFTLVEKPTRGSARTRGLGKRQHNTSPTAAALVSASGFCPKDGRIYHRKRTCIITVISRSRMPTDARVYTEAIGFWTEISPNPAD